MVRPSTEDLHVWWLGPMGIGQCCIAGGSNHGCESSQETKYEEKREQYLRNQHQLNQNLHQHLEPHQHNSLLYFLFLVATFSFPMTPSITGLLRSLPS